MTPGAYDFTFRGVRPADFEEVKSIHLSLFPLQYSDEFLRNACEGVGLNGRQLFSSIVTLSGEPETIVGFIFCQFIPRDNCEEADVLDEASNSTQTFYILTLGLLAKYRRCGLGRQLLTQCLDHAAACADCGMVYLHVIDYNLPAMYFYEKHQFVSVKEIPGFYRIKGVDYTAYTYAKFLNAGYPTISLRLYTSLRMHSLSIFGVMYRWVGAIFPSMISGPVCAEYMDGKIYQGLREGYQASQGADVTV